MNIPEHYITPNKINKIIRKPLSDNELKAILGKEAQNHHVSRFG
jgi:hypothetical protein